MSDAITAGDGVGERLRAGREARGWSVDDVAARLKIPARYVDALESGDQSALPEATFVRGYVKAYARALGLDAGDMLAALAPVEVKAPRPLIGPDGQVGASRRSTAAARAPSFRSSRRRLWIPAGLAIAGLVAWALWSVPAPETPGEVVAKVVPPAPAPAVPVAAEAVVQPVVSGGVTTAITLPGLPATTPPAPVTDGIATVAAPATTTVPGTTPVTAIATPLPASTATATRPASPPPGTTPVPPARPGLHVRFSNTSWIEVRDADNLVIYTRIAMPGNEVTLEGKAPLTVTLGDGAAAQLWYNGERVVADRFSANGIARIIVGNAR